MIRQPTRSPSTALLVSGAALALAACGAKAPKDLPPAPQASTTPMGEGSMANPGAPVPGSQADFVASITSDTIRFDTDKFDIDAESRAILTSQAQWLARYPGKRATIEGHCDERGTREYNLALGERRANAARAFLAAQGIDASRLTTVSYGKERPLALGSDEESWAKNRRAVTVTVQ